MKSVRQQLIEQFPPPRRAIEADKISENALYRMLRSINDPDMTVDGWTVCKVTGETDESPDAVGLMTLLPGGSTPIALRVDATSFGLTWHAEASLSLR